MTATEGAVGGKRLNRLVDQGIAWYQGEVGRLMGELMADGFPPFTVPRSPLEQYQALIAMRAAGDPMFWDDPLAQQELARLELRFGEQPAIIGGGGQWPGLTPQ